MRLVTRQAALRSAALSVLSVAVPQPAHSGDLSDFVRRSVVRSAQIADQADSVWQQLSGEVVPAWQRPQNLATSTTPPMLIDVDFANDLLSLPLEVAARCTGTSIATLLERVPAARSDAVLLYQEGSENRQPLQNEPFYGALSKPGQAPDGVAKRGFSPAIAAAAASGEYANTTVFGFEAYARWRVLQAVLSDERAPEERRALQRCFSQRLGEELLQGPLRTAVRATPTAAAPSVPRAEKSLLAAVDGCGELLGLMQAKGLFSRYALQTTMGSGTDEFDAGDWEAGGSTQWMYIVSGSALVGGSQLAQDRTAATGRGAGLYPGQLLTAPLAAYLRQQGVAARLEEYFLDNRVGRPDPRTFSDPRYYSDTLLEVIALEDRAARSAS